MEAEGRRCIRSPAMSPIRNIARRRCRRLSEKFGKLDILVNNAAFQEHVNDFEDLSDEHFDPTIKTNLYGYFYMAKAAVPANEERQRHRHDRFGHRACSATRTCSTIR